MIRSAYLSIVVFVMAPAIIASVLSLRTFVIARRLEASVRRPAVYVTSQLHPFTFGVGRFTVPVYPRRAPAFLVLAASAVWLSAFVWLFFVRFH